ncbi:hypothetical protein CAFE_02180 [Caprobacter fermentans]|uniref:Membrane protein YkvI n=1 Tax=Caproicibacter fermentans TaxID=2576756 RepID=A0A6N8HV31_9FIRM|nr:hypothetical protein [Caproicibacter fermentans]MVB09562.1 hypothetical protein [Caproicibacter fermentans]OCN02171.1 hypothetical protein A7X67_12200 [Clostridium sp. W14A]
MINKNKMPVAIGVAFVWFTTQFGGGFASGAQLLTYFVQFGIWTLVTPILAQAFGAFFQWYGLRYAKRHNTYDYRTFTDTFYGDLGKGTKTVFSNLYEVVYIVTICLASAVAFATGGSTLEALTGIPYLLCTLVIGAVIFVLTIFGTDIVRAAASTISVAIIVGLLVVYIPNIIAQWGTISANIGQLSVAPAPVAPALWKCLLYGAFQLASIGLLMQHAEPFENEKVAKTSMIYGFIVNAGIIFICTLGMLAVVKNPDLATAKVPTLLMVTTGVGAAVLTPIISILIILGSVSTAVNMIAGVVKRFVTAWNKKDASPEESGKKSTQRTMTIAILFTLLTFAIAQFGLIPLVAVGYGYLGYLTIFVVLIPFLIHMFLTRAGKIDSEFKKN